MDHVIMGVRHASSEPSPGSTSRTDFEPVFCTTMVGLGNGLFGCKATPGSMVTFRLQLASSARDVPVAAMRRTARNA